MEVRILDGAESVCEAFVLQRPDGKSCHLPAWSRAIQQALGHRPLYLIAYEGSSVRGVLPLTEVRSRLFGHRMISQALSDYGGPLADSPTAVDALYHRAVELSAERRCESIEFRNVNPLPYDLHLRSGKICMHLELTADPEELWKGFSAKVRNQVRKAEKSDLVAVKGRLELLDDFYHVYTLRMRQLGSPCYSRRVMREILNAFPESSWLFVVRKNGLTLGGGLTLCSNGFVEIPFAATLLEYNKLCPNNLLYWAVIKHYSLAGAQRFDFGRCTIGGGPHKFKKQWGPEPVPLHYQYWSRAGHELRIASPDNVRYSRKVEMWKKLPLWATRLMGPRISRGLP